jgi:hypothetical protein
MAITITDSPNNLTVKGQKLIYVCSSDNTAETGFKYIVVVKDESGTQIGKYYKSPNPAGRLIFDLRSIVDELVKVDIVDSQQSDGIIHNMPHASNQQFTIARKGMKLFEVEFGELYEVAGVLTEFLNLASDTTYINDGYLQVRNGYKNPLTDYTTNTNGLNKVWLLNREAEFHKESGLTGIVIKSNQSEYGCVAWWFSSTGIIGADTPIVQYNIYDADGLVDSQSLLYEGNFGGPANSSTVAEDQQTYGAFYPGNISDANSVFTDTPANTTDWTYYTLAIYNQEETSISSLPLIFVNSCPSNKHVSSQLAWTNSVGGWEYLTFNGRRKDQVSSRSKNFTRDNGTYSDTTFGFNSFDRMETSFHIDTTLSYTLYKQNASDVDSRLLESLSKSKNVMVNLDGTVDPLWLPVVITGNNFELQPSKSSKNQTLTVRIKLAQTEQA